MFEDRCKSLCELIQGLIIKPLRPNLRTEAEGYTWGREAAASRILAFLQSSIWFTPVSPTSKIIAELWLMIDDPVYPELIRLPDRQPARLAALLHDYGPEILGPNHLKRFGPWLGVAAKIIDTNKLPTVGTLSAQVHPQPNIQGGGAKPETWIGLHADSRIHVGFNRTFSHDGFIAACKTGSVEAAMQPANHLLASSIVHIPGGFPHAIGADAALLEVSVAASERDATPLHARTIAFYDRWFGRLARPDKEQPSAAAALLAESGFLNKATLPQRDWRERLPTNNSCTIKEFSVDNHYRILRLKITTSYKLEMDDEPLMFCVLEGSGACQGAGLVEPITAGCYGIVPHCLEAVMFHADPNKPLTIIAWQAEAVVPRR